LVGCHAGEEYSLLYKGYGFVQLASDNLRLERHVERGEWLWPYLIVSERFKKDGRFKWRGHV
jgi:hypothetical protein